MNTVKYVMIIARRPSTNTTITTPVLCYTEADIIRNLQNTVESLGEGWEGAALGVDGASYDMVTSEISGFKKMMESLT